MGVRGTARDAEIARKNRENYDETDGPVWRLAVYDSLHEGWEFINMGGEGLLDALARRAQLGPGRAALELCSGQGAPCHYLALRYGCRATGVEINPRQAARARDRLDRLPAALARRLRFVEADALAFRPRRRYDLVFSLDSLMLLPDPAALLARAARALAPGALLAASTLAAGGGLDAVLRRFLWASDGMASLHRAREYRRMLAGAGLARPAVEDLGRLAVSFSQRSLLALQRHRAAIVERQGEAAHRSWVEAAERYLDAFQAGHLRYLLLSGRAA